MLYKELRIEPYFIFSCFLYLLLSLGLANKAFGQDSSIDSIRMSFSTGITRIVLDTTHHAPFSAFILDNPNRLVIDIEAGEVKKNNYEPKGIVKNIRIGQQEPGVQRIVFDLDVSAIIIDQFNLKKTTKLSKTKEQN